LGISQNWTTQERDVFSMEEKAYHNPRKKISVLINGKYLAGGPTAVHLVADEIIKEIFQIYNHSTYLKSNYDIELAVPVTGVMRATELGLACTVLRPFSGIPWEQLTLPILTRNSLVLSFCNSGPVFRTEAVTMMHDAQVFIVPQSYDGATRVWRKFLMKVCGLNNGKILTVSRFSREQLINCNIAPARKIDVVYNGVCHVADSDSDPRILEQLGISKETGYFTGLANVQPHKNISVLLKAFQRSSISRYKLVLFGGAKKSDFESAGIAIPDNVIFAGYVSNEELKCLYENAIAMCFPSTTEGFGLPPLESMSLGTPAIVSPCGALPEILKDAVLYANADNPDDWEKSIRTFAEIKCIRDSYSTKGKLRAKKYTWNNAANQVLKLIDSYASQR